MPPLSTNGHSTPNPHSSLPAHMQEWKLAINLYDLDRIAPTLRTKLFSGRLDLSKPLSTAWDRTNIKEEVAVLFTCDLLTAAIICDTVRSHDRKAGDFPTRLYLKRKSWARIPSGVVLTALTEENKCVLNPKVFSLEMGKLGQTPLTPSKPLTPQPLDIGSPAT